MDAPLREAPLADAPELGPCPRRGSDPRRDLRPRPLLAGQNLTTGPGYDTIRWALDPTHSVALVAAILVLRCLATTTTVAGGGVGGLFIPLVVAGALVGRIVGGAVNALDTSLFTVIGSRRSSAPATAFPSQPSCSSPK